MLVIAAIFHYKIMNKSILRPRAAGFTLIEIMVVVVILGILAAIVVPRVMDAPDKARITKAKQDIAAMQSALNLYKLDNYVYPSTQQGLQSLVAPPQGEPAARNWKPGGYIDRLPDDPWGHPYQYACPSTHNNADGFDVWTTGPDGDIGNWSETRK